MNDRLADHCGRLLAGRADSDSRIWVLDGDLADSDGAIHFAERHPSRFVMSGIAEQNMVSMAAGMAECGLRPFVFSFAAFLAFRAYDQIRVCVSQCRQPVTLIGSHSGGIGGRNGKSHAALNDLALMLSLPGMQVWAPADDADVEYVVRSALSRGEPGYVRLPRRVIGKDEALSGAAAPYRWLSPPAAVSMVSTGLATHWALDAARRLSEMGQQVGLLHVLHLSPAVVRGALTGSGEMPVQLIVVEDHCRHGGLASLVQESVPALHVTGLGWPADWCGQSGDDYALMRRGGLSGPRIADVVRNVASSRRQLSIAEKVESHAEHDLPR